MRKTVLKVLGSVLLLWYLFHKVGWQDVWTQLQDVNPLFLAIYIVLGLLGVLVSTIRWFHLSHPQGIMATIPRLFTLNMVGLFFNNVLPTSVGGDVVRAYELGKFSGKKEEAIASVFVDRFVGLTMLIIFSLVGVFVDRRYLEDTRVVIALSSAVVGYLFILFLIYKRFPIRKLLKIYDSIHFYRDQKQALLIAMGYSILFYLLTVVNVYVGCLIFDTEVLFSSLFVAVPLMLLLFMIPISIGGIGLQEWAYYFVLATIGVPAAVGLSLGLIYRARTIGFGLIGGALYPFLSK